MCSGNISSMGLVQINMKNIEESGLFKKPIQILVPEMPILRAFVKSFPPVQKTPNI
jgi:hypothetical protein